MNTISDILFVISNGLLIPVIVLLLYLACRAVWLLFSFYGEYRQRKKIAGILRHLVRNYSADELDKAEAELAECGEFCVTESIKNLLAHRRDRIYCELILSDFQVDVEKRLSRHRSTGKIRSDAWADGNADSDGAGIGRTCRGRHSIHGVQHAGGVRHHGGRNGGGSRRTGDATGRPEILCPLT